MANEAKNPYDLPTIAEDEQERPYWLGTLPTAPVWNIGIGGISFPRYCNPPVDVDKDTGETQRAWARGTVEMLKPSKYRAILEMLKVKVVRFHGTSGRGSVHNITHPLYNRQPGDQPLAMHVYIVALDEAAMTMRETSRGGYPKSVYKMAGGKDEPIIPPIRGPQVAPGIEDLDVPASRRK